MALTACGLQEELADVDQARREARELAECTQAERDEYKAKAEALIRRVAELETQQNVAHEASTEYTTNMVELRVQVKQMEERLTTADRVHKEQLSCVEDELLVLRESDIALKRERETLRLEIESLTAKCEQLRLQLNTSENINEEMRRESRQEHEVSLRAHQEQEASYQADVTQLRYGHSIVFIILMLDHTELTSRPCIRSTQGQWTLLR